VGVVGIEVTIISKLLSYESPMELLEEVKETMAGAVSSFQAPEMLAGACTQSPLSQLNLRRWVAFLNTKFGWYLVVDAIASY
jgi:uncharacterized protein (DUF2384 family)